MTRDTLTGQHLQKAISLQRARSQLLDLRSSELGGLMHYSCWETEPRARFQPLSRGIQNLECPPSQKIFFLTCKFRYMDKLSVEQAQAEVYGFIEPQSIQKSGNTQVQIQQYMQTWMSDSRRDIFMAPYIDGSHWQLMVIILKEYTMVWFCSLHRKPSHKVKCQLQAHDESLCAIFVNL
uniref:Ubiquitin-like protease family profile domain-containing protein n=1 Tax=Cajanus cajan TaxID=3821 RepID=A0A151QWR9_CAJCA|nr:hypothetical protein KK1_044370 [Cajanus cajan]